MSRTLWPSRHDFGLIRRLWQQRRRPVAPAPHRPDPLSWAPDEIAAAWLGHASLLLQLGGLRVLSDPILGDFAGVHVGPLSFGIKRLVAPALTPKQLPALDLLLITHAHMDHLDFWTLRRLPRDLPVVTAPRTGDLLRRAGFRKVEELAWDQQTAISVPGRGSLKVTALQVNHWGARLRHDHHRLYSGYLLEGDGHRICIAGDTAYTDRFAALRRFGPIDLMAVPIGAYDPWVRSHCNPEQALAMADIAGAERLVPIHHQTFKLSQEPYEEPIQRFTAALGRRADRLALHQIGETARL
jgi:L-ascorbate metabolism protein UlaG (beta-lactamase superfamily)